MRISGHQYILKMLNHLDMENVIPRDTPMDIKFKHDAQRCC
jgi:hypothetical protein